MDMVFNKTLFNKGLTVKWKSIMFFIIAFSSLSFSALGQTQEETEYFIQEIVKGNSPTYGQKNEIWFEASPKDMNYSGDAHFLAGRHLTSDEIRYMMIWSHFSDFDSMFGSEVGGGRTFWFQTLIDLRDVERITTINRDGAYELVMKLKGTYLCVSYASMAGEKPSRDRQTEINIPISNKESVLRLKRAVLHLCGLHGFNVKDGDLF